jgi:hypothetical protein
LLQQSAHVVYKNQNHLFAFTSKSAVALIARMPTLWLVIGYNLSRQAERFYPALFQYNKWFIVHLDQLIFLRFSSTRYRSKFVFVALLFQAWVIRTVWLLIREIATRIDRTEPLKGINQDIFDFKNAVEIANTKKLTALQETDKDALLKAFIIIKKCQMGYLSTEVESAGNEFKEKKGITTQEEDNSYKDDIKAKFLALMWYQLQRKVGSPEAAILIELYFKKFEASLQYAVWSTVWADRALILFNTSCKQSSFLRAQFPIFSRRS